MASNPPPPAATTYAAPTYAAPTYAAPAVGTSSVAAAPAVPQQVYYPPAPQVPAGGPQAFTAPLAGPAPPPPPANVVYGPPAYAAPPPGAVDPSETAPPPAYTAIYTDPTKSPTIFDPQTNQPVYYQVQDQWVVVNTTHALRMFCPYDQDWVTTHCEKAPGGQALCCCMFLWCFCWPLMLCPFLMPSCYDEVHICPRCNRTLAVVPAGQRAT
ncbi:hypothetical protein DFJ74DRAFT_654876 [Hyaloraphidium curvatum]|nr:hypothetical protein DFJ74DRAFT_654876 [Hyaloraphidium curvatum]